jgi:hypothetical protein
MITATPFWASIMIAATRRWVLNNGDTVLGTSDREHGDGASELSRSRLGIGLSSIMKARRLLQEARLT